METLNGSPNVDGQKDGGKNIGKELVTNRGISGVLLAPRQYVVAAAKYLSNSTVFAVFDNVNKKVFLRLDKPHVNGANFPHINVNPKVTGVPDPHIPIPGALLTVAKPLGWVMRNAGGAIMALTAGIDIYRISKTARAERKETGGFGAETGKVAAGTFGAWTGGFVGAAVGARVGAMAGWLLGPVGAGVGGIVGAVIGGVWASTKGRNVCEYLVGQQKQA